MDESGKVDVNIGTGQRYIQVSMHKKVVLTSFNIKSNYDGRLILRKAWKDELNGCTLWQGFGEAHQ